MVKLVKTKDELVGFLQSNKLVVVYFTASWCGPCRMIAPEVDRLEREHTKITFLKVDVDNFDEVGEYGISGVPTFLFSKDNTEEKRVIGARVQDLEIELEQFSK